MNYYLFDASALVLFYQKANNKLDEIFIQHAKNKAILYLPQFCVAEAFNTFARLYYRDKTIDKNTYQSFVDVFKEHISHRKLIYCYDLHRYHNINADDVIKAEQTIPYNGGKALSTLDILIISMAIELTHFHPKNNVFVVTGDKRMHKICKLSTDFPKCILVYDKRPAS